MAKFKFHKFNRRVHLYTGLIMVPYIFVFGLSGLIFNHPTMFSNRSSDTFEMDKRTDFQEIFPNIEDLAASITDSIINEKIISNPAIENVKYSNTMILRNANDIADYRMQIDIPSSRVQLITLPDFVNEGPVVRGNLDFDLKIDSQMLLSRAEDILRNKGIEPGQSRVQRIPNLIFDLKNKTKSYRVTYNLTSGNYRIDDLSKRDFKISYMLTNLHESHGYPVAGFSFTWLWVFFADVLAVLMIVWAISGLIMWFKMKRQFTIGVTLLSISITIFILILISRYELGY